MSVNRIEHPELFFGLVAPVGADLDMIIEVLRTELLLQKYNTSMIHVTEIMQEVPSNIILKDEPYLERINTRIEYADEICSRIEREDALAAITITAIQSVRERLNTEIAKKKGRPCRPIRRRCKRPCKHRSLNKVSFCVSSNGQKR
jgi:cytidine deaminase